jgi:hypothetical protein
LVAHSVFDDAAMITRQAAHRPKTLVLGLPGTTTATYGGTRPPRCRRDGGSACLQYT